MPPKVGTYFAINRTPYRVVMVQPNYVVAEHFDSGMGTTFTRDYWTQNAKFCTFAWALLNAEGNYALSEQEPPSDQPSKRVVVIEL